MTFIREQEGGLVANFFATLGRFTFLTFQALLGGPGILFRKDSRQTFLQQLYIVGIGTLPVATVVAMFTGMILTLQLGIAFKQFSQELMVAYTLSFAMLREMGPFMTGIILASCVGSAMAAQLGTMKINEEVAAIEMMSTLTGLPP